MKRHLILPAVGLAGIAGLMFAASAQGLPLPAATSTGSPSPSPTVTLSPSPSAEPSVTPDPEPEGDVTADIRVELDLPSSTSGPMVFQVLGVPVNDEIELIDEPAISNPTGWCGDATVDIAADLSSVVFTGGDDYCYFEEAYLYIELHGAEWGDVSLDSDTLFFDGEQPVAFTSFGGAGRGALSAGLHLGPISDEAIPELVFAEANGSVFEAYWFGDDVGASMSGAAVFSFSAPGAEPVGGEPNFTG